MRCVVPTGIAVTVLVAGCSTFQNEATSQFHDSGHWDTSGRLSITTADVRVVSSRRHPVSGQLVVCTEPSPDVAKAISSALQIAGKASQNQTSAQGSIQTSTAQSLTALAGRSTALLALRDGLYHACEAYANGALGADAYALVLARYGQLMTSLFLAQDMTDMLSAHSTALAATQSPQLPGFQGAQGDGAGASTDSANGATKKPTPQAKDPPDTPSPGDSPAASVQPLSTSTTPPRSTPGVSSTQAGSAIGAGVLSLVRMPEDFYALDRSPVQILVVACINYSDQSHIKPTNPWLEQVCSQINSLQGMNALLTGAVDQEIRAGRPGPLVDPTAALSAQGGDGTTPSSSAKSASAGGSVTPATFSRQEIKAAQVKLLALGYKMSTADGLMGTKTRSALRQFQNSKGLSPTGNLDARTLSGLEVATSASLPPASR